MNSARVAISSALAENHVMLILATHFRSQLCSWVAPGISICETIAHWEVCRHCLQILTTETTKILHTIHIMILDKYVSRWGLSNILGLTHPQAPPLLVFNAQNFAKMLVVSRLQVEQGVRVIGR